MTQCTGGKLRVTVRFRFRGGPSARAVECYQGFRVKVRVRFAFCRLGLSFTEYIHAGVIELVLDDFR